MHESKVTEPWITFLQEVNQQLSENIEVECSGGFVLTAMYGVPRATNDLDYVGVRPHLAAQELERIAGRESRLADKHKIYFQNASGVTDLPENYEERLIDLSLGLSKLSLKTLEPYDLVLSKLTRNGPKDRDDVKYLAGKLKLNFATVSERFKREMNYVANLERHSATLEGLWREYFVR